MSSDLKTHLFTGQPYISSSLHTEVIECPICHSHVTVRGATWFDRVAGLYKCRDCLPKSRLDEIKESEKNQ